LASVLVDTGPLVALFKRNDSFHARAVAWFKAQRGRLVTTQAVLTEAWHLVSPPARLPLVRFVTAAFDLHPGSSELQLRVLAVLERYADLPMDYADATLVVVAETQRIAHIATIDVNDFSTYRLANGKALKLVF
jgi:predicted nucleic acid-binding protein